MGARTGLDDQFIGGRPVWLAGGLLRWSRPGVFLAIVLSAVQQFADGDLAPWDNPDGQVVNAADVLIAVQLALGRRTPGPLQFAHGDMNVDGVIDLADLLLIQQAVLQ